MNHAALSKIGWRNAIFGCGACLALTTCSAADHQAHYDTVHGESPQSVELEMLDIISAEVRRGARSITVSDNHGAPDSASIIVEFSHTTRERGVARLVEVFTYLPVGQLTSIGSGGWAHSDVRVAGVHAYSLGRSVTGEPVLAFVLDRDRKVAHLGTSGERSVTPFDSLAGTLRLTSGSHVALFDGPTAEQVIRCNECTIATSHGGNLDGDHRIEVIFNARSAQLTADSPGSATMGLFKATADSESQLLPFDIGFALHETPWAVLGSHLSTDCDTDGDGYDDLLVLSTAVGGENEREGVSALALSNISTDRPHRTLAEVWHGSATAVTEPITSAEPDEARLWWGSPVHELVCAGPLDAVAGDDWLVLGRPHEGNDATTIAISMLSHHGRVEFAPIVLDTRAERLQQLETGGDIDGDGYSDLVAVTTSTTAASESRLDVFFGPIDATLDFATPDLAITSEARIYDLSLRGDVDGDGRTDLVALIGDQPRAIWVVRSSALTPYLKRTN